MSRDREAVSVSASASGASTDADTASTVVLVGHGSRDPRSAAALFALTERVRGQRPGVEVRLCFLELSVPSLEQTLSAVTGRAVVVPLLLGSAYHARVDIPDRVRASARAGRSAPVTVTATLGGPGVGAALERRIATAPDVDSWVLCAAGSSHARANQAIRARAARLAERSGRRIRPGFVTAAPGVAEACARLQAAGARRLGVLPWFLAPGRLLDRAIAEAQAAGATVVASPLADDPAVARAVWTRYDAAVRRAVTCAEAGR